MGPYTFVGFYLPKSYQVLMVKGRKIPAFQAGGREKLFQKMARAFSKQIPVFLGHYLIRILPNPEEGVFASSSTSSLPVSEEGRRGQDALLKVTAQGLRPIKNLGQS